MYIGTNYIQCEIPDAATASAHGQRVVRQGGNGNSRIDRSPAQNPTQSQTASHKKQWYHRKKKTSQTPESPSSKAGIGGKRGNATKPAPHGGDTQGDSPEV